MVCIVVPTAALAELLSTSCGMTDVSTTEYVVVVFANVEWLKVTLVVGVVSRVVSKLVRAILKAEMTPLV